MFTEAVDKKFYFHPKHTLPYIKQFDLASMWDRTGTIAPNDKIELLTPIGSLVSEANIYDICMERAQELASLVKDNDKKLHVFWSGGLDSTTALLAIRECLPASKIVILYTDRSLEEYPGFFEKHIHGVYETFHFSMATLWTAVEHACAHGIAVTGEIGDQLFGSVIFMDRDTDWFIRPWQEFDAEITSDESYHRLVEVCPQKIDNVAQFIWWINYTLKYQLAQCRILLDNTVGRLNDNVHHFFDAKSFNDYAVSTPMEDKMPGYNLAAYKKPVRDVIYRLSNDFDYAYTKPKVRSLEPVYGKFSIRRRAKAIATDWTRYY